MVRPVVRRGSTGPPSGLLQGDSDAINFRLSGPGRAMRIKVVQVTAKIISARKNASLDRYYSATRAILKSRDIPMHSKPKQIGLKTTKEPVMATV